MAELTEKTAIAEAVKIGDELCNLMSDQPYRAIFVAASVPGHLLVRVLDTQVNIERQSLVTRHVPLSRFRGLVREQVSDLKNLLGMEKRRMWGRIAS